MIRERLAAVPGVSQVAVGLSAPLRRGGGIRDIQVENRTLPGPAPRAMFRTADASYFSVAGIQVLKGRAFDPGDNAAAPLVAVINRALAKQAFGDQDPIGRRIAFTAASARGLRLTDDWRTVVGVVNDTRDEGLESDPAPSMYLPFEQGVMFGGTFLVRTVADPLALRKTLVDAIHDVAPNQVIDKIETLESIRDETVVPRRLNALFVASFAALAFLIAIVGIVGVLASSVRSRRSELGIRMALGAGPERLRRMVLTEGGVLIGLGIAIGIAGSFFTVRLMSGLLYGVTAYDPATFTAAILLLAGVGIASCLGPARRAGSVDPAVALRAD
jgi:putative ABC transport system permease protein